MMSSDENAEQLTPREEAVILARETLLEMSPSGHTILRNEDLRAICDAAIVAHEELRDRVDVVGDVAAFHKKFGLQYDGKPRILHGELGEFRVKFLEEELKEFKKDHYKGTYDLQTRPHLVADRLAGMLDALVDLVYVAVGNAYMMGVPFAEAWRRVQVANMAKARATTPSARGGMFDVVKPPGWTPPDHSDLVRDHAHQELP